jgi:hypothetical protein
MTEAPISPLRRRMIEDMTIRKFAPACPPLAPLRRKQTTLALTDSSHEDHTKYAI